MKDDRYREGEVLSTVFTQFLPNAVIDLVTDNDSLRSNLKRAVFGFREKLNGKIKETQG